MKYYSNLNVEGKELIDWLYLVSWTASKGEECIVSFWLNDSIYDIEFEKGVLHEEFIKEFLGVLSDEGEHIPELWYFIATGYKYQYIEDCKKNLKTEK